MRYLLSFMVLLIMAGCSVELDDLQTYTQSVKERTVPQIEPYPEFKTHPPFMYSASALRSPFEQPKTANAPVSKPRIENCYQPDFQREPKGRAPVHGAILVDRVDENQNDNERGTEYQYRSDCCGDRAKLRLSSGIEIAFSRFHEVSDDTHGLLPVSSSFADWHGFAPKLICLPSVF